MSLEEEQELAAGYILEDLSPEEAEFFEQLLKEKSYLHQNIRTLQESFAVIPEELVLATPPTQLKDKILSALSEESSIDKAVTTSQNKPSKDLGKKIALGLAALGAIALIIDNVRLRQQLQFAQQEKLNSVAEIMQQDKSRLVALKSANDRNQTKGNLLFTPGKWERVVLSLQDLPPLPADRVYRLWLTLENGEVLPCGDFNTDGDRQVFIELKPPKTPPQGVKATGLFVTSDRRDAPLQPTGDKILSGQILKTS
jgi:hypothetical protein